MVTGLDNIEKIVVTLCPETLEETAYQCVGYMNFGTFSKGKLVEWYKPLNDHSGHTGHSIEYLTLFAATHNKVAKTYIRGQDLIPPKYEGLGGKENGKK